VIAQEKPDQSLRTCMRIQGCCNIGFDFPGGPEPFWGAVVDIGCYAVRLQPIPSIPKKEMLLAGERWW
jgi:hypothetical protein